MNKYTVVCYSLVKYDLKRGINRRTQTNISQQDGNVIIYNNKMKLNVARNYERMHKNVDFYGI